MRRPKSLARQAPQAGITRYLQLYTLLAQDLADGRFAPEQPLPSEPALVKLHGLSRTTVRRALERLEREGRIVRRRGSGTYARRAREPERHSLSIERLSGLGSQGSQGSRARTLHSTRGPVPPRLRKRHPSLGERTTISQRLHFLNGHPVRTETLYADGAPRSARILHVRHEVGVAVAEAIAAKHLRVPVGTPLLRISSEFCGPSGHLVALSESLLRADRTGLEAQLVRRNGSGWQLK